MISRAVLRRRATSATVISSSNDNRILEFFMGERLPLGVTFNRLPTAECWRLRTKWKIAAPQKQSKARILQPQAESTDS